MAASSAENTIQIMYNVYNEALSKRTQEKSLYKKHAKQGRKSHNSGALEGQRARGGHLIRLNKSENFYDDEGRLLFRWVPRGKLIEDSECVRDPDWLWWRAHHSTGWKEHKHRYQWEHNVCEKEKHQKNRARKALRRGEFTILPEK